MNSEEHTEEKLSFEEIVAGKDVALGKEIVESLKSEDIGVSVIKQSFSERKTKVNIDREVGEEDYSVRETSEFPSSLLGLVIATENEGEFVYFGIQEQGFVFKSDRKETQNEYNSEINSVKVTESDKFIETLTRFDFLYRAEITLKEDDSPEEFNRIFAAAVEKQREKVKRTKIRRAEARSKLKQGLFGKSD